MVFVHAGTRIMIRSEGDRGSAAGRSWRRSRSGWRCRCVLGTNSLVEGPSRGTSSDIVTGAGIWAAKSNCAWLHTTSIGSGNGLATFTFDANTGATRTGTLTVEHLDEDAHHLDLLGTNKSERRGG